jgi:O-methyltransferase
MAEAGLLPRLRRALGVRLLSGTGPQPALRRNVLYEVDAQFAGIRADALARTGTADGGAKSAEKLYNTVQFFKAAAGQDGLVAECGVFRGLSAYVFCRYRQLAVPGFSGHGVALFDSFEGLSAPIAQDRVADEKQVFIDPASREKGAFQGTLDVVRRTLEPFPDVTYRQGWIPASLEGLAEASYSFVHIDVDLYEPTRGAIEYFFPRLKQGGAIVCDDYAFLHWPGAKQGIDEYCQARGIPVIPLTTGQCVIVKGLGA